MSRRGNNLQKRPGKSLSTETDKYGFVQQNVNVPDGRGGFTQEWTNTSPKEHSMAILPLTAKQVLEYKSVNVEASHLIKMRAEIPVSELNRIVYNGRIFEILSAEDIQEKGVVNWVFTKERRS